MNIATKYTGAFGLNTLQKKPRRRMEAVELVSMDAFLMEMSVSESMTSQFIATVKSAGFLALA